MMLADAAQRVHSLAIQQPKITGIQGNVHARDFVDQAIKQLRCPQLEFGLALALGAHRVHHLVALFPLGHHVQDDAGRVLQVSVDDDHSLALSVIRTCGNGDLMSKISGEVDDVHPRILLVQVQHDFVGSIPTAIVDQHQLPRLSQRFHGFGDALVELGQDGFLVVDRCDNGDGRAGGGCGFFGHGMRCAGVDEAG